METFAVSPKTRAEIEGELSQIARLISDSRAEIERAMAGEPGTFEVAATAAILHAFL